MNGTVTPQHGGGGDGAVEEEEHAARQKPRTNTVKSRIMIRSFLRPKRRFWTVIGDVTGRMLRDAGRLRLESKSFQYQTGTRVETAQFDEFDPQAGHLNLLLGTVGAKFNPVGDLLIGASVLFPLTDSGLRNRLTSVVSLDYAF